MFKSVDRLRVELSDVPAHFEQERILEFKCSLNQSLVLLFLRQQLGIARVCCQVYCQGNQLFADNWLGAVYDQLV